MQLLWTIHDTPRVLQKNCLSGAAFSRSKKPMLRHNMGLQSLGTGGQKWSRYQPFQLRTTPQSMWTKFDPRYLPTPPARHAFAALAICVTEREDRRRSAA